MTVVAAPLDAAALEQFLEEVDVGGLVALPALSWEELVALEPISGSPLRDAAVDAWWGGLDESTRTAVKASAWHGLVARGLLTPAADHASGGMRPAVGLAAVLTARRTPAFIAIVAEPTTDPAGALRVYGAAEPTANPRWVLIERRQNHVHRFVGATPQRSLEELTDWLVAPPSRPPIGAPGAIAAGLSDEPPPTTRTCEVARPLAAEAEPGRERLVVLAGSVALARCDVAIDGSVGAPYRISRPEVADWLRWALLG